MSGDVYQLQDNQGKAVDPRESVWLSASAGTGKTQVLSARVLRLLLQPATDPSQILCLTFTKAGAAEMAVRINDVLARWVRLDGPKLAKELGYLGADIGPETQARARTLFASVLDCPGGGLRIDTIHAFSQWLLANFPNEAGLIPGARPIEDRERDLLMREVLSNMLQDAERANDHQILAAVGEYSRRKGPDALQEWLMRCAKQHELWFGAGAWQAPMLPQVLQLLGVPSDADEAWVSDVLSPDIFPDQHLREMLPTLAGWNAKGGRESVALIEPWLKLDVAARVEAVPGFYDTILKKDGEPRVMKKPCDADPLFAGRQQEIAESIALYAERQALLDFAHFLAPSLELGRAFALRWDAAKQVEGLLDFDDLIQRAADLLSKRVSADWIRFKLDRQFDHILVDEAQDTNAPQWAIIDALIDDFFSGEGARGDKLRTIFTVGDYKQAIFGFQGTSPENFRKAKGRVANSMRQASENAQDIRRLNAPGILQDLDLGRSFRTTMPVLDFVNRAIAALGWDALGLDEAPSEHVGEEGPGLVTLWHPVRGEDALDSQADNAARDNEDKGEKGAENWLAKHDRLMADNIARQVQQWMSDDPFILSNKGETRPATPGDVMVLVRSRKDLAALIVARLHAKGVPVAGVDRLRLGAPLAVKDIMAAVRFAAQPLDDLNLANLLSSPLIGWSQDDILAFVPRGKGKRLWDHLRKLDDPTAQQSIEKLKDILNLADFETPQALLQWILVGPWQGRAKLIARLGREANDPIDELLNAAFTYEAGNTPSLAGFIRWFDAGEAELKRDPGENADLVRVMTVHGSKGLEAPIVILADATGEPGRVRDLALDEELPGDSDGRAIPVPPLSAIDRRGRIAEAHDAAKQVELQEHWRLLYVAMTRAKQALFIGGSLSQKAKAPHEDSWYARLEALFDPASGLEDPVFNARFELGERARHSGKSGSIAAASGPPEAPQWAVTPIGPEPRPPRPLAPSSSGEDHSADPPLPAELVQSAARRGVLIHSLLERLPDVEAASRENAAMHWLGRQASDLDEAARAEILTSALRVIADPDFAEVFSANALAEVPLAATVGGEVIAGIADRLLITPDAITVVDFKTARRPPASLAAIPQSTIKQMAAYVCALEVIYPGRAVRAAVLYTQTPKLFTLTEEMLGQHKQAFVQG